MELYTKSLLNEYNTCPKRYKYKYEDRIDVEASPLNVSPSLALEVGNHVHKLFETGERIDDGYPALLAEIMYQISFVAHNELQFPEFHYHAKELQLGMFLDGKKVAGKIDSIVELANGDLWCLDYKTSRYFADINKFKMDIGFDIYVMLARLHGYNVKGMIVYSLRRPTVYRNKSMNDEEYIEKCSVDMLSRLDTYYDMSYLTKDEDRLAQARADIKANISHIELCDSKGYWHRSTNACNDYNKPCPFLSLCMGQYQVSECSKRELRHPELDIETIQYKEI